MPGANHLTKNLDRTSVRIESTWWMACIRKLAAVLSVAAVVPATFIGLSESARGECGDYIIIGNKAKLAELQAAGFDTGHGPKSMQSSAADQKHASRSVDKSGSPKGAPSFAMPFTSLFVSPFTTPCRGEGCREGLPRVPKTPAGVPVFGGAGKPVHMKPCDVGLPGEIRFKGHQLDSVRPFSWKLLIDRPPE